MAAKAEPGPWRSDGYFRVWSHGQEEVVSEGDSGGGVVDGATGLWIAALSPAIAEPLAALLDAIAADIAGFTPGFADDFPEVHLARLILEASGG
jgi:hypothetical protein